MINTILQVAFLGIENNIGTIGEVLSQIDDLNVEYDEDAISEEGSIYEIPQDTPCQEFVYEWRTNGPLY